MLTPVVYFGLSLDQSKTLSLVAFFSFSQNDNCDVK